MFHECRHGDLSITTDASRLDLDVIHGFLSRSYWAAGILKVMNSGMMNREEVNEYVNHVLSVDPLLFTNLLKSMQESSAEDILKKVKVPTLIVAGDEDQFTPAWISKKMHRLIPESELFMMHKATHAGLVEQPDLFNLRIEKFLSFISILHGMSGLSAEKSFFLFSSASVLSTLKMSFNLEFTSFLNFGIVVSLSCKKRHL